MTTPNYERAARFLWDLLDAIDTASDIARANDALYRQAVEGIQRRRFEVGDTTGWGPVVFKEAP